MATKAPPIRPLTPAWSTFTEALALLAERGMRTPCAGKDDWTSEEPADLAAAAAACEGCPVIDLCRAAADSTREAAGVWAGRIRTPATKKEAS